MLNLSPAFPVCGRGLENVSRSIQRKTLSLKQGGELGYQSHDGRDRGTGCCFCKA